MKRNYVIMLKIDKNELRTHYKCLLEQINDIMYYEWDPLGVSGMSPKDEYESYAIKAVGVLVNKPTYEALYDVFTDSLKNMGSENLRESHQYTELEERLIRKMLDLPNKG